MSSLTHCISKSNISKYEGKTLMNRAKAIRLDEGFSPKESNRMAVIETIESLKTERNDITGQIRARLPEYFEKLAQNIETELKSMSEDSIDETLDSVFGPEKTTGKIAKKAGVGAVEGVKEAVKGLAALFGDPSTLRTGPAFDEDSYAKAKPHFQKAWAHAKESGFQLKELAEYLYKQFGDSIRPYLKRFLMDVREGKDVSAFDLETVSNFITNYLDGTKDPLKNITGYRKVVADFLNFSKIERNKGSFLKQTEEAIEFAVIKEARKIIDKRKSQPRSEIFDALVDLYNRQPTLGTRTTESTQGQAYSTPVPIAYLVSELAGINQSTSIYEPTAGTGMLLVGANSELVTANELDPSRVEILQKQFDVVTQKDAMANKPAKSRVVVGNPPFGTVKGQEWTVDGFTTTQIDQAIILESLKVMESDGSAVFVFGGLNKLTENRKKVYNSGNRRRFFEKLYGDYNVTDHFTLGGNLYKKQGTTWPIDIVVIKGKGQSQKALPGFQAPPVIKTFFEIRNKIDERNPIYGVDATLREQESADFGPHKGTQEPSSPYRRSISEQSGRRGVETNTQVGRPAGITSDAGVMPGKERTVAPGVQPREKKTDTGIGEPAASVSRAGVGLDVTAKQREDETRPEGREDVERTGDRGVGGGVSGGHRRDVIVSEGQSVYTPASSAYSLGSLVPKNMAGPIQKSLQKIRDEHGSVDEFVKTELQYKNLSDLHNAFAAEQIDALALILDNFQQNCGFICGDQTGQGKGRVVAGIIRHTLLNNKTPVFVTEKTTLYKDMYRDLIDIGMTDIADQIMMTNANQQIFFDEAETVGLKTTNAWTEKLRLLKGMPKGKKIVFTTYDQMKTQYSRSGTQAPRRQFLEKLVAADDAVLILDEAHNAGGSGDLTKLRVNKKTGLMPCPVAKFFRELISYADNVLYSSATYAKNPDVMDLYKATDLRLGVGGDIEELATTMHIGGIPFQQITASMLAEAGQYIRRERSFDGVSYSPEVMDVDTFAAESISAVMLKIRKFEDQTIQGVFKALGNDLQGSTAVGAVGEKSQNFTSLMHNLIDQMLLSLKTEISTQKAIQILQEGQKNNEQVVMTVANTMGSFVKDFVNENGLNDGDVITLSFNDLLYRYLWNTRRYSVVSRNGEGTHFWLTDKEMGENLAEFNQLRDSILTMDLDNMPVSPIDYMHNEFKKAGIATGEITGRQHIIDYSGKKPVYRRRPKKELTINGKNQTIGHYNSGNIRVIIANRSAAAGISLHASEKNPKTGQGKRHMLIVQAEKDINMHMQMLGRVHRTGQVIAPSYIQVVANLPAEKRPAAILLAKMKSLNANTTAATDSLFSDREGVNFLNKYGDEITVNALIERPELNRLLGYPIKYDENGKLDSMDAAKKVTGRLPLLPSKEQEKIYTAITNAYFDLIQELDAKGENDLESKTLPLQAVTDSTSILKEKTGKSPFAGEVVAEETTVKRLGKPMSSEQVESLVNEHKGEEKVLNDALQEHEKYVEGLKEKYWARLEKAETEEKKQEIRKIMNSHQIQLQKELNTFTSKQQWLTVGQPVIMPTTGENITGIIVGIKKRGKTKKFLAQSSWMIKIALADGIRSLTLPMSRIGGTGQVTTMVEVRKGYIPKTLQRETIDSFDTAITQTTEKRTIVTGNLFSGYIDMRPHNGQLVNFTRQDNSTEQGVLMPRGFNTKMTLATTPIAFENSAQILQFLKEQSPMRAFLNLPGDLKLFHYRDQFGVSVKGAQKTGGRFFKDDKELIRIVGSFHSRADRMITDALNEKQAKKVVELFLNRGNVWKAHEGIEEARKIINKVKYSKTKTTTPASTVSQVKKSLYKSLGKTKTDNLINSGQVRIVGNSADLPGASTEYSKDDKILGAFIGNNIYLVAENLTEETAYPVLLHESIHAEVNHNGWSGLFGKRGRAIKAQFEKMLADGHEGLLSAQEKARSVETSEANMFEETLAHFIQDSANHNTSLFKRILRAVRAWAVRAGLTRNVTAEDLVALAEAAVRRHAKIVPDGRMAETGVAPLFSQMNQAISSVATSLNQVAALFNKTWLKPNTVNLDIGGGKFDKGTESLFKRNIENLVYDPFNRSKSHNDEVIRRVQTGGINTTSATNVLNVIKEKNIRNEVIRQSAKAVAQDGTSYFQIYEGDKKSIGRVSKIKEGKAISWQNNQPTRFYIDEIKKHFEEVTTKRNFIIAKSPIKDASASIWADEYGHLQFSKYSEPLVNEFAQKPDIQYSKKPAKKSYQAALERYQAKQPVGSYQETLEPVTSEDYVENRKTSRNIKLAAATNVRRVASEIVEGIDKYLGSISTRLGNVSLKLKAKMRRLDFDINKKYADSVKAVQPLLAKAKKMNRNDFADWDYARKNSDVDMIQALINKYDMQKEYNAYRETLDGLRKEGIDVGLEIGEIEEYAPRILKDDKGFLEAIGKAKYRPLYSDKLKERAQEMETTVEAMPHDIKASLISNIILGGWTGLGGIPATKHRMLKKIPAGLNRFYMHSDAALMQHLHSMRKGIEARKFFGKIPQKVAVMRTRLHNAQAKIRELNKQIKSELPENELAKLKKRRNKYIGLEKQYTAYIAKYALQRDYRENIGSYVLELISNKEIDEKHEKVVNDILNARFHEVGTHGIVQAYKNLSYIDTMGSPISALTQIGDLAWVAYEGGFFRTFKHAFRSITKKSRITKEDIGIERIAQEFADSGTLSNAVSKVFKVVGLEKIDSIGKESILNTALEKYQGRAKKDPAKLKRKIRPIFENETDNVIDDLVNDEISDNVKLLVYSRLLDFQPVGLSEMPQRYLDAGNGRLFYMLKTFTIKVFDVFRNEVYNKIKNGDKAEKIQGFKNLISLSACFVLMNAGADELKDWFLGRKTDLDDRVIDNVLRLFGVSKFVTWKARTEGIGSALSRQILPPFKFIDSAGKDIITAGDDRGLEILASVPVAGKLVYWHYGRGASKREDLWDRRLRKYKAKLNKTKDKLDKAKNKVAFKREHKKELLALRKVNKFQGKLNSYRKRINRIKSRAETKAGKLRIQQLEKKRTNMIKKFLDKN